MKELSIIIPVYNEEGNVLLLYESLKEELDKLGKSYEIIFVNDGSTDNTLKILNKMKNKVRVVTIHQNKGLSHALSEGFKSASGNIVVTLDGDLQNDPSDIPALIKKLDCCDAVCGWRYDRKDSFLIKNLPSRIFNLIISAFFNIKIHDASCTLRAYKKNAARSLRFLKNGEHRIIPVLLSLKGFKVSELKVKHNARKSGKAKYNSPWRFVQGLKAIYQIKFLKNKKKID